MWTEAPSSTRLRECVGSQLGEDGASEPAPDGGVTDGSVPSWLDASAGSDGGAPDPTGDDGGCGCIGASTPTIPVFSWLALLVWLAVRRRLAALN